MAASERGVAAGASAAGGGWASDLTRRSPEVRGGASRGTVKADEAEGLFRSVVDAGDPTFSGFATMCLGDIARAKKDNAAAGAFYRELAEKFPASAFALQSGGYLLRKSLFDIQSPVRIEPVVEQK